MEIRAVIQKEAKIWLAALSVGLLVAFTAASYTQALSERTLEEISQNVIRFHVVPHGDTVADQQLKDDVRDAVLARFRNRVFMEGDITAGRAFLAENLDLIEAYATALVRQKGYDYPVTAQFGRTHFPTRDYGALSFPRGEYEALQIIIGEGEGENWWCVMFPPLCYVDAATHVPQNEAIIYATNTLAQNGDIQLLSRDISENTLTLLTHRQHGPDVTIRFRLVEWWQGWA